MIDPLDVSVANVELQPEAPTVTAIATREQLDLYANPLCFSTYSTILAFLNSPLKLRYPLPVSIKVWTDGVVEAHFADAILYGTGEDESEALDDLRENIEAAWTRLSKTPEASLAKPALRMWRALSAVCGCDVP